jgi:hypothetical protein
MNEGGNGTLRVSRPNSKLFVPMEILLAPAGLATDVLGQRYIILVSTRATGTCSSVCVKM